MKKEIAHQTASDIIQQLIKLRGAEITEVAKKWGVSRVTVYSYLENPGKMSDTQIEILAAELRIDKSVLDSILMGGISTIGNALAAV